MDAKTKNKKNQNSFAYLHLGKNSDMLSQLRFDFRTLFLFSILSLIFLSSISFASINPKLQLQNYSISEFPAQPGHVVYLTLHIKSLEADNCAERVAVQLTVSYPLSIQGADTQYVEGLCYSDPAEKGTFTFALPVDNLATSGTYSVQVSTSYEKRFTKLSESNIINLKVGGSPAFVAAVTSSNPVDIYPGDSALVTVTVQNTGPSMAMSAHTSASSDGILVKWAGKNQELGQIPAHGSVSATFAIEAPKDLAPGDYPLNIWLDYIGEDKSSGNGHFTFNVPVKQKPEFFANYSDSDALLSGQQKEVRVQISNTGTEEARKLKIRIKPLFPFSTDGTVRYIESLKPNETQTLVYVITVDKDATTGAQLSGLLIDFENPQGKKFSDSTDFSMPIRQSTIIDEAKQYWFFGLLLLVIVVFMAFRKMKKPAKG